MRETYRDTGMTGTHRGATGSASLYDDTKDFEVFNAIGRLLANTTTGASGLVTAQTKHTVTATLTGGSSATWASGDAYTLYFGASASAVLSSTWVCRRSGFAAPREDLEDDILPEFVDADQRDMDKGRR